MKKYVPSGYQIINIDLTGKQSGSSWEPSTEDEKILFDLLTRNNNGEIVKPILLYEKMHKMSGLAILSNNVCSLSIGFTGSQVVLTIYTALEKIGFTYQED